VRVAGHHRARDLPRDAHDHPVVCARLFGAAKPCNDPTVPHVCARGRWAKEAKRPSNIAR
jgi:hypothetical protein